MMYYGMKPVCLWITLLVCSILITFGKGASVSLTVEGGVSLVGPHCPGTATLFCEGVDLFFLRWSYNGNMIIMSYFPDSPSTTQPEESDFFMVQLTDIEQNPIDPSIGNYSSYLTVNFSELQSHSVEQISCGSSGVSQIVFEPVNVTVIAPSLPSNPTITIVTAVYQFRKLNHVKVTWTRSDNYCSSHGLSLVYEVNITAYNSSTVNQLNCSDASCEIVFNNLNGRTEAITVSIVATNDFGSSDLVIFPNSIAYQVQQYFLPEVFNRNGQLIGKCTAIENFVGSEMCTVQYTTDSMYKNLSNKTTIPLSTEFLILDPPHTSGRTYYFEFSVVFNGTLQITERIAFSTMTATSVPGWGIALIVIGCLGITIAVGIILLLLLIKPTRKRWQKNKPKEGSPEREEFQLDQISNAPEESPKQKHVPTEGLNERNKDSQCDQTHGERLNPTTQAAGAANGNTDSLAETDTPSKKETITVSVVSFEARVDHSRFKAKPYTVYQIVVKFHDKTNTVYKRYNEFSNFYKVIQGKYPSEVSHLKFPGKRRKGDNYEEGFLEMRRVAFHNIINNLIKIPEILNFPPFLEFLGVREIKVE